MAIDFPGADEYIACGSGATIDNIFDGGGSVAFWIKIGAYGADDVVMSKAQWYIDLTAAGLVRFAQLFDGATNGRWSIAGPGAGTWAHVGINYVNAYTSDPDIYLNGVLQSETEAITPAGTRVSDAASNLLLAAYDTSGSYGFDGQLEDVRLYSSVSALTGQEIAILAAGYRGPMGGEVGWWSMNDAQAITTWDGASLTVNANYLPDMSGNGNTGNPTGTPLGIASSCPHMPLWIAHAYSLAGQLYTQAVAGAMTFVGTFGPTVVSKVVAGAQTFAGTVNKAIDLAHGFTGAITFVGAVTKRTILHGFDGAITFAGTLTKRISKIVVGAISFVGELLRRKMVPSTITLDASISAGVVTDASVTADVALDSSAEAGVLLRRT